MSDPEAVYRRITSGDPGAVSAASDQLLDARSALADVDQVMAQAAAIPAWAGGAASSFTQRAAMLRSGAQATGAMIERAGGALRTAADAQQAAVADAEHLIGFWRNRPPGIPGPIEEILASLVTLQLTRVASAYNTQLSAVDGVLNGEDVDLDELDEETREWVEQGLAKNEEWLSGEGSESGLGPVIPNTAAAGDDRGLVPQGLGITDDGNLVQSYYREDGTSVIAIVDPVTGQELSEVEIGDGAGGSPGHVGGVTVIGDEVYVTDTGGATYTYPLSELSGSSSTPVQPSRRPLDFAGGSYNAYHDGRYFSGDFDNDVMQVYEKQHGEWVEIKPPVSTPPDSQGVVVRDGEYVFSTSSGRTNESSLVVQDRFDSADRSDPYPLPNLSQGVVEHDGELITSYESGAEEYDHTKWFGFVPGIADDDDLWANPYYTTTPLGALNDPTTGEPLEVDPATLSDSGATYQGAVDALGGVAATVGAVQVSPFVFGEVPAGPTLSSSVTQLVDRVTQSLKDGEAAVGLLADNLDAMARTYTATDQAVGSSFGGRLP